MLNCSGKVKGHHFTEMFALTDEVMERQIFLRNPKFRKYYTESVLFKISKLIGNHDPECYRFPENTECYKLEFKYNHCWLRILVNKEWRFIDVIFRKCITNS
ncbi:ANM_HP_G0242870.mRNA.1.CDS.1 [Saccharomyces cerevisiae]|nr:ANM_HP_G0242870.mRNA.1.CDS.1 [Saccharomyces cerevisiae]CAI7002491.1 ANM_HP_G0242870.mRNA.1.CDS.1 [Saccharomyces cerevisiae]